ncbi:MAG: hypothetical protein E6J09_10340 [Chloroflexi bacterium]|nr:MAG: hypothetical protein E6J09_10340 [Chloroflexota bacterium]
MTDQRIADLAVKLEAARGRISRLLEGVAGDQDWSTGDPHWSFRFIAAHMEATDAECLLVRIRQIAFETTPSFDFYNNTGWDFSERDLHDSLLGWQQSRAQPSATLPCPTISRSVSSMTWSIRRISRR